MTTQLARHAVIQITLTAYSVLISGAGMRFARVVERPPNVLIQGLHDYGFLLLLIPAAWFFASLRESRYMEAHEENDRKTISYFATAGSIALVACAFVTSLTVLNSYARTPPPIEQKKENNASKPRGFLL